MERIIFLVSEQFKKHGGPRFDLVVDIWHQSCLGWIFSEGESFWDLLGISEEVLGGVKGSLCLLFMAGPVILGSETRPSRTDSRGLMVVWEKTVSNRIAWGLEKGK